MSEDTDAIRALLPVDGGRIVAVGGSTSGASPAAVVLARYQVDGRLDPSFGGEGSGRSRPDARQPIEVGGAALDPGGRIVVAGDGGTSDRQFVVLRVDADGALDRAFGEDGIARTVIGSASHARAIAVQADGRIVVAGDGGGGDFAVARYLPDGRLDPAFGVGGVVTTDFEGREDAAAALALMGDGRVVVGGVSGSGDDGDVALARYLPDGSLDPTFGVLGRVRTPVGSRRDAVRALAVDDDGSIVTAGASFRPPQLGEEMIVLRHRPDGTPDPAFGAGGVARPPTGGTFDSANALLLLPDGTLLVAGARRRPEGRALGGELVLPPTDMLLARLDATSGALDPTFGSGGLVVTSLGGWEDRAFALVRLPDGRLAAGGVYDPNGVFGYEGDFGLTRYLPDGRLDPSFGGECAWEEKPLTRPMM